MQNSFHTLAAYSFIQKQTITDFNRKEFSNKMDFYITRYPHLMSYDSSHSGCRRRPASSWCFELSPKGEHRNNIKYTGGGEGLGSWNLFH